MAYTRADSAMMPNTLMDFGGLPPSTSRVPADTQTTCMQNTVRCTNPSYG